MSGRLDAIESLVVPANTIADVGCDHGRVAEYCLKSGKAKKVIASDISEECLEKAKSRIGGAKNVEFIVCDGLGYECDEAVIAGMGGLMIERILLSAKALPKTLVLCPHRDAYAVRSTLSRLGYAIDVDTMIKDRDKFYPIIRAVLCDEKAELNEMQLLFGAYYTEKNVALKEYLEKLIGTYMRAPTRNADKILKVKSVLNTQ